MGIKKIRINNFKSFNDLEVKLGNLNILVGANASGKSNFIRIFEFLRDIARLGLDNAVSMQADVEFLRNLNIGSAMDLSVEVISDLGTEFELPGSNSKGAFVIKANETSYKFAMKFYRQKMGIESVKDALNIKCEFFELQRQRNGAKQKNKIGDGDLTIRNDRGKIKYDFKIPEDVPLKKEEILPRILFEEKLSKKTLLLETHIFHLPFHVDRLFQDFSIYNIDPRLSKQATPISGKTELEEDASNLAIVLKNITSNGEKKRKFTNLIGDILSFIDEFDVERFTDKSLLVKILESYAKDKFLPASLISDGTIGVTALIVALYFRKEGLTIIEEPERNIHPYLISKLVNMLKDASQNKQIIVTTHNPMMIKYADLDDILLVSRCKDGYSYISRPIEKEEIKIFLDNEMAIEELYVQNLLEV